MFWAHHRGPRGQGNHGHGEQPLRSSMKHDQNPFHNPYVQRATGWQATERPASGRDKSWNGAKSVPPREYTTGPGSPWTRKGGGPAVQSQLGAVDVLARVGSLAMLCSFVLWVAGMLSGIS